MPFSVTKIIGLSSTYIAIKKACDFFNKYAATIRPAVPEGDLAVYDAGVLAVTALCDILKAVARAQISGTEG